MILFYVELFLGFASQLSLIAIMRTVGAHRQFWAFFAWMVFSAVKTVPLFLLFEVGTRQQYFAAYWCVQIIDYFFQLAVCFNVFSDGDRRRGDRIVFGVTLAAIALAVGYTPLAATSYGLAGLLSLAIQLSQGTSLGLAIAFFAAVIALRLRHITLRIRGRGILAGLGIAVSGDLAYAGLFGVFGMSSLWCLHLCRLTYFAALYVWIIHLLRLDKPFVPNKEMVLRLLRRMRELLGDNATMEMSKL